MNLIEKYKVNKFKAMIGYLKKYDQELEIYRSIVEIDEKGTTFLDGNTWSGYLNNANYSFSIKNTSTDKVFEIKKGDKEVTLTLRKFAGYFYRQLSTKNTARKKLTDDNIIETVTTETEKKIFQDGIECVNSKEFLKECFVVKNGNKSILDGECVETSKTAIRELDGTILIDEIEKTNKKQNRRTFVMHGVSIITENIVSISNKEKIEVDVNVFDNYMQGNVNAIEELIKGKVYQKNA